MSRCEVVRRTLRANDYWSTRLEISRLLCDLNENVLSEKVEEIIKIFGSVKDLIRNMIKYGTHEQLNNLKQLFDIIININKYDDSSNTIENKNESNTNKKIFLGCQLKLNHLPKPMLKHIISYADKKSIYNMTSVDRQFGSICCTVMNSFTIIFCNITSYLNTFHSGQRRVRRLLEKQCRPWDRRRIRINHSKYKLYDRAESPSKFVFKYNELTEIINKNFHIAPKNQLLYNAKPYEKFCQLLSQDADIGILEHNLAEMDILILNKSHCGLIKNVNPSHDSPPHNFFFWIRYFDVKSQCLVLIDFIVYRSNHLDKNIFKKKLMEYIKKNVIKINIMVFMVVNF